MTNAVLNPEPSPKMDGHVGRIALRATEPANVTSIKKGDTIIDSNLNDMQVYRVVSKSMRTREGVWTLCFDADRDVPVPPQDDVTISHDVRSYSDTSDVEKVTDLGTFEMASAMRLRPLDKLADGRGVWEVAKHVSSDRQLLVRFAQSDNFVKMPPGTVMLVEGRQTNRHVESGMAKSEERRYGKWEW